MGHSVGDLYHDDKMAVVIKKGMNTQLRMSLTTSRVTEDGKWKLTAPQPQLL